MLEEAAANCSLSSNSSTVLRILGKKKHVQQNKNKSVMGNERKVSRKSKKAVLYIMLCLLCYFLGLIDLAALIFWSYCTIRLVVLPVSSSFYWSWFVLCPLSIGCCTSFVLFCLAVVHPSFPFDWPLYILRSLLIGCCTSFVLF